jgi:maleate isomerase
MTDTMEEPLGDKFTAPPPAGWKPMDVAYRGAPAVSLGLIALSSDSGIEPELHRFLDFDDVTIHTNRIYSPRYSSLESLRAMEQGLGAAAANLMPDGHLDVIAYGCTSATMALGPQAVAAGVRQGRDGIPVVDPISSSLAGLEHLRCRRIALLTPYIGEVNEVVERYITDRGFDIATKGFFGARDDDERSRVSLEAFAAAADELVTGPDIEALFISCTALRTSSVIAALEDRLEIPVVASNQALAWAALRAAGDHRTAPGRGRLFQS